jgi:hypothetical protein
MDKYQDEMDEMEDMDGYQNEMDPICRKDMPDRYNDEEFLQ